METSGQELMPDCYSKQLQHAAVFLLLLQTGYSASSQTSAGVIQGISILGGGGELDVSSLLLGVSCIIMGRAWEGGGGGGGGGVHQFWGECPPLD